MTGPDAEHHALRRKAENARENLRIVAHRYREFHDERNDGMSASRPSGRSKPGKPVSAPPPGRDHAALVALVMCARLIVDAEAHLDLPGQLVKPWFHTRLGHRREVVHETIGIEVTHPDGWPTVPATVETTCTRVVESIWTPDADELVWDVIDPGVMALAVGGLISKLGWAMTVDSDEHREGLADACTAVNRALGVLDALDAAPQQCSRPLCWRVRDGRHRLCRTCRRHERLAS